MSPSYSSYSDAPPSLDFLPANNWILAVPSLVVRPPHGRVCDRFVEEDLIQRSEVDLIFSQYQSLGRAALVRPSVRPRPSPASVGSARLTFSLDCSL